MMEVALWWGYDRSLAIELWQLFCGGDTTVVRILKDAICFVVGTRQ
jgi:hypothetical protein